MFNVSIKNRLTQEVVWPTFFPTMDKVNEWIALHAERGINGEAFGSFYSERRVLKSSSYEAALVESEVEIDGVMWVNLYPEYEYTVEDKTAEEEAQLAEDVLITSGKASTDKCNRVLNYLSGYNQSQEFTTEQINTMITTFSAVNSYLKAGMPSSALIAVNDATPDGVVVTEALKTKIIALLG